MEKKTNNPLDVLVELWEDIWTPVREKPKPMANSVSFPPPLKLSPEPKTSISP